MAWAAGRPPEMERATFFFCSAFIDCIKGRFEAIKDIYSPYRIKLHLSSLCCVIVPLNSSHHTKSFSLAHEGSRWQRYGNTSFVPSLSFCVSSCIPSVISFQLLHFSFNVSPYRLLLHHLPSFARVLLFSFCKPGMVWRIQSEIPCALHLPFSPNLGLT